MCVFNRFYISFVVVIFALSAGFLSSHFCLVFRRRAGLPVDSGNGAHTCVCTSHVSTTVHCNKKSPPRSVWQTGSQNRQQIIVAALCLSRCSDCSERFIRINIYTSVVFSFFFFFFYINRVSKRFWYLICAYLHDYSTTAKEYPHSNNNKNNLSATQNTG